MIRILLAACVVAACGGGSSKAIPDSGSHGDGAAGSGTGPISLDDFAAAYAKAFCMKEFSCCTPAERGSGDEPSCEAQILATEQAGVVEYKKYIAAGDMTYDPVASGTCLDFYNAEACGEYFSNLERVITPPQCAGVFKPLVANGGDCTSDDECVSFNCVGYDDDDMTPGACMAADAVGDQCDSRCATGLYCDANATCQTLLSDGATCQSAVQCTGNACTANACAEMPPVCAGN